MSSLIGNARVDSARRPRAAVPAHARELAARLSALFDKDSGIAARLNGAQRRLRHANDRLWSGLAPDAFGLIYDGAAPAGHSQLAELIGATVAAGGPGPRVAVLAALQEIHWAVHRAFCEYQSACEERRQLAVEVGELAVAADRRAERRRLQPAGCTARRCPPARPGLAGERLPGERAMSDYRDSIHCRTCPAQVSRPDGGRPVQEISVIMTDDHRSGGWRERCWLPPAICTLTPGEAREFASELLELAEQAKRIGAGL